MANVKRGLVFVISAPAGTGKTTLVKKLTEEFPTISRCISYTTRQPRASEVSGVDYHFVTREQFEAKIKENDFLEYVRLYDHYYGTSKSWVNEKLDKGQHVVLVIDTQGAMFLKGKMDAIYIFLMPPSMEELERRLISRNTDKKQVIETRLEWAKKEIEARADYDYVIVNDDLNTAYDVLRSILIAEEHRTRLLRPAKKFN